MLRLGYLFAIKEGAMSYHVIYAGAIVECQTPDEAVALAKAISGAGQLEGQKDEKNESEPELATQN